MKKIFAFAIMTLFVSNAYAQFDFCYWIEPDDTYTHPDVAFWPGSPGNTADNYSQPIALPFNFNFFGQNYNEVVLTTKGTIIMGNSGYIDFSPSSFPTPLVNETIQQYNHICGFWSDFDFGGGGELYYKVTNDALYVNYIEVGKWPSDGSQRNTFQMIICATGSSVIGNGNNVQFYYKDMQWANSPLNGAEDGFNSATSHAIIGADKSSGNEHFAFGRFDQPTANYNGPYGVASNQLDGIYWLNGKNIEFNTAISSNNTPPGIVSDFCHDLTLCNESGHLNILFTSSEESQDVAVTLNGLPNGVTYTTQDYPSATKITIDVDPTSAQVSDYIIEVIATDDGIPSQNVSYFFNLGISEGSYTLEISGNTELCSGGSTILTGSPDMDYYYWDNGETSQSSIYETQGMVTLIALKNGCYLEASVNLTMTPYFIASLEGGNNPILICPGQETEICVAGTYSSYSWIVVPEHPGEFIEGSAQNEECAQVAGISGDYLITVTNEEGCEGFNIKQVIAQNYEIPQESSTSICGFENVVEFSGAYETMEDNLIFYGLSTNNNGWQGSYIQIYVHHIDGNIDTSFFTIFTSFATFDDLLVSNEDSIVIEYFANGNEFQGNSLWLINCGQTSPTVFPAPLNNGIIWAGMSGCEGLPVNGQWTVDGPEGWTLSDQTTYNTQFQSNSYGNYSLCFTPEACENSYCYEIQIENEPSLELQLSDTMLLCGSESVVIVPIADPQYDINWQGEGLNIASDNLSATAGPYIGYGETDIIASQTNSCGTSADSIHIIYLNELNPGLAEEMFTCGELLLDPFPGESNDAYIDCIWTNISTNESQYTPTYNITTPGFFSGQFSNACYNTQPIVFEVIFEDSLVDFNELNGDIIFCDNEGLEVFSTWLVNAEYQWYLDPPQAGSIINVDQNQLTLDFTDGYAGIATVSVVLTNSCGSSDPAELEVLIDDCSDVKEKPGFAFQIYPNPAQDFLIVDGNEFIESIKILDQLGQELWSGSNRRIDIRDIPTGIYLISIQGEISNTIQRVEILR
ncbi:MAG: T9SS type A sorting domain-containing protein [Flavobacteriales bacterium]|nr:T9SS type A sorting domain-containing protein [Flavobacteriales bacterium]